MGPLANQDTVCSPNHVELCTNLPLKWGHLSIQDSQLGLNGVHYSTERFHCMFNSINSIFNSIRACTEAVGWVQCQEVPHREKLHVVVHDPQVNLCASCPVSSNHLSLSHHCQCMPTFSMPFELCVAADAVDIVDFTFCIRDKS